jgi:hypothetical protein
MGNEEGKPRPAPAKPSASSFDLRPVSTGRSASSLPRTADSAFDLTAVPPRPASAPRPGPASPLTARPALKGPSPLQKQLQASAFEDDEDEEKTQLDAVLGRAERRGQGSDGDEEPATEVVEVFDGVTPAAGVTSTDTWNAVHAPVQSRPGRRSWKVYWNVIDQFAVGHNPRYAPDAKGLRAHLFVWDVSRAMGCEVPHLVGGREINLGSTVDWLRNEGPSVGWRKAQTPAALAAAEQGLAVLAVPRDGRHKLVVVVRPGGAGKDGLPRVASATSVRQADVSVRQALGTPAVDYYVHL